MRAALPRLLAGDLLVNFGPLPLNPDAKRGFLRTVLCQHNTIMVNKILRKPKVSAG